MNVHFTFSIFVCQSLLDKVSCLFKVNADVEVVCVAGRYAVVDDARAGVELGAGIDVHEGVSLCGVQDVGDAEALQAHHVRRHKCIADVYPWVNLVEVFCWPAVEAAFVRQEIVELLERHLEAGHVESVGSRCLHLLVMFVLHVRGRAVDLPRSNERGRQVSCYRDRKSVV